MTMHLRQWDTINQLHTSNPLFQAAHFEKMWDLNHVWKFGG
eukprot:CAMPEP_0171345308 /NCGR_PEP_ID=MMETSP0878-20121228/21204_1 /TAXON_ID=67004 /ORGANISM="Thalassiosira weissflogii, Strain CCMP1336" /LENGTH=40 /DNA_ID= /DNA_START= /DNA_END= /DNA_ORIENTATION=